MQKNKIINVVSNSNFESRKVRADLMENLKKRGYEVAKQFNQMASLTISIGGDGAFLKAIHKNNMPTMPLVGINTGHLGFFQEINPKEIKEFLDSYEAGNYEVEEMPLVYAEVITKNRKFILYALNEIVLKGKASKIIQMDVFIERNHLQKFVGDGIIISTPVGSTAYNYSLGGAIVYPTLESLQIMPIAAINSSAYRSLGSSVLVPGDTIITLKPEARYKNHSIIVVDGEEHEYNDLYKVEFKIAPKKITRLVFKKDFYWNNLKDKFL